ncbi:MAG: FHA domain-containing protein [Archangium sp.]|nr:FHA domain-containing protein [Archangium sp.]
MPESLLAWFNRFMDDPKKLEARLAGRPVLLYEPPETPPTETGSDEDDDYQFRTQSGISVPAIGGGEPLAVIVEKTKDNAFQRRVTVGRTSNNDIVLDDNSVSRFHAWLQLDDAGWTIVDAGSRNGTWVGGKKLVVKAPATLASGVRVKVGAIELTYFTTEGFLKMLKSRANG